MTSAPAIGFEYRPSRLLLRLLPAVAALALLAILLGGLPTWLKGLLMLAVVVATLRAALGVLRSRVAAVGLDAEGNWHLRMTDRSDQPASLRSFRILGPCVLLRLHAAGADAGTVVLAPDNSDADIRRRLRMRLAATGPGRGAVSH